MTIDCTPLCALCGTPLEYYLLVNADTQNFFPVWLCRSPFHGYTKVEGTPTSCRYCRSPYLLHTSYQVRYACSNPDCKTHFIKRLTGMKLYGLFNTFYYSEPVFTFYYNEPVFTFTLSDNKVNKIMYLSNFSSFLSDFLNTLLSKRPPVDILI